MDKKNYRAAATARRDGERRGLDSFSALALYAPHARPVKSQFDPRLSLAVDRALVALDSATADDERELLKARLRDLERRAFGGAR